MSHESDATAAMIIWARSEHGGPEASVAVRSSLGDAAVLCDAIARDLLQAHRGRGGKGKTTKLGWELASIAKRCGDALWKVRKETFPPDPLPSAPAAPDLRESGETG